LTGGCAMAVVLMTVALKQKSRQMDSPFRTDHVDWNGQIHDRSGPASAKESSVDADEFATQMDQ